MNPTPKAHTTRETFTATIERQVGWSGAGCQGYAMLRVGDELRSAQNIPLDSDELEFDDEIEVIITVRLLKRPKKRGKQRHCHNPWPAHVCDDGKYRKPERRK